MRLKVIIPIVLLLIGLLIGIIVGYFFSKKSEPEISVSIPIPTENVQITPSIRITPTPIVDRMAKYNTTFQLYTKEICPEIYNGQIASKPVTALEFPLQINAQLLSSTTQHVVDSMNCSGLGIFYLNLNDNEQYTIYDYQSDYGIPITDGEDIQFDKKAGIAYDVKNDFSYKFVLFSGMMRPYYSVDQYIGFIYIAKKICAKLHPSDSYCADIEIISERPFLKGNDPQVIAVLDKFGTPADDPNFPNAKKIDHEKYEEAEWTILNQLIRKGYGQQLIQKMENQLKAFSSK